MAPITIDVPKGTETKYKDFVSSVVENYSVDDLEDILLGLHINNNSKNDEFVPESDVLKSLRK